MEKTGFYFIIFDEKLFIYLFVYLFVCLFSGSSEMLMANAVQELAGRTPGKESIAIESFARALRQLPTIIGDNAGYDSSELISQLRALHSEGKMSMGLGRST